MKYNFQDIKVGDIYQHELGEGAYFVITEISEQSNTVVSFDVSRKRPKDLHHRIQDIVLVWNKRNVF